MSKKLSPELERVATQADAFNESVKSFSEDVTKRPKVDESEPQTKMSSKEVAKSRDVYLKPERSLPPGIDPKSGKKEQFNEAFREAYNFAKEYVQFIAENRELIGSDIEIWTKKFPGTNCEFWRVPSNKPVWGPRYLAEQIKGCNYRRLTMNEAAQPVAVGSSQFGTETWSPVIETTVQRLDAHPAAQKKSIFMGANGF